jgi:hypothetical protein
MLIIDVKADGIDERFMTNDSGNYLFMLVDGAAKQINHDSGCNSLRRMKKAIREYLSFQHGSVSKLSYKPLADSGWVK